MVELTRADDVFARLAEAQPALSPKMARLADFISRNHLEAGFMTTRELADAAGVSLATVVRFPAVIGYENIDALRDAIQDRVNFDLTGVEHLRRLPKEDRSPTALLRRIIHGDIQSLNTLATTFSEESFNRFVQAILDAERVTILGFRYVSPLALYLEYSLSKVIANVQVETRSSSLLYDRIGLMGEGDLIIAIAMFRYPKALIELLRYARQRGIRIITVTDTSLSPVLPLADVALFARVGQLDFVGSLAAPAALLNCVVSEIGIRLGDAALARLEALEEAALAGDTYIRSDGSNPDPFPQLMRWQDQDDGRD